MQAEYMKWQSVTECNVFITWSSHMSMQPTLWRSEAVVGSGGSLKNAGQNLVKISAVVDLLSNTCVPPTILDCLWSHCIPYLSHHHHNLQEVNLLNVLFSCIIHVYCMRTEGSAIMCLEALNYSSIERLNIWCEIGLEVDELNTSGFIWDFMAREVIKSKSNMAHFTVKLQVNIFKPFFKELWCHLHGLVVAILKTIIQHLLLPKTPWLYHLLNEKYWLFHGTCLVTHEWDSNAKLVWFLAGHLL